MSDGPEPTPERLSEHAIPATYRRAPRTERFIMTGVGVGAGVGIILGAILPAGTGIGRGTAALLLGIAGALVGGLITGAQAAYIEYTSGRSSDRQREALLQARAERRPTEPGQARHTAQTPDNAAPDDEGTADGPR